MGNVSTGTRKNTVTRQITFLNILTINQFFNHNHTFKWLKSAMFSGTKGPCFEWAELTICRTQGMCITSGGEG